MLDYRLLGTRAGDGRGVALVNDGTGAATAGLNRLDDPDGLGICDLAEDDVLAIEPRGNDGGDEELGAVAMIRIRVNHVFPKV